ncbi:MAG: hypothetical protein LAO21_18085 [Acidobacteriia bacterium]|nr:hypothetical protein [Terriglobia bacterium]
MGQIKAMLWAVLGSLLLAAPVVAQTISACPPTPETKLEGLENIPGTVIIRGTTPIGSISARAASGTGSVTVRSREVTDVGSERREYGIAIGVVEGGHPHEGVLVDYEEIAPLLNAIDYLNKLDWSATSLKSFDAVYTMKNSFRVAALARQRTSPIEFAIRTCRLKETTVLLSRDQLVQLRGFIEQGRIQLDTLRSGR